MESPREILLNKVESFIAKLERLHEMSSHLRDALERPETHTEGVEFLLLEQEYQRLFDLLNPSTFA